MKAITIYLTSFLCICTGFLYANSDSLKYKQIDRFRGHFDLSVSLSSFKLMGVSDISNSSLTFIDNHEVVNSPDFKYTEKRVYGLNVLSHIGLNIPFYRNKNWSTGIKLNGGVGYQYGIGAENFSSIIFDFPQYVYYRNYKKDFDFTILAGYKYTLAPISYGVFLLGFDYNLSNRNAIRFHISPYRTTYYSQLTNGDIKPAIRVVELGIGFIF